METVKLPEFYYALAFPTASIEFDGALPERELPVIETVTNEYLLSKLQEEYPNLKQIEVEFKEYEWGKEKPSKTYQAYCKVVTTMIFDKPSPPASLPDPRDLYDLAGKLFENVYYLDFLTSHELIVGQQTKSRLLAKATKVQIGVPKVDTPGGACRAPNFYMGFVCDPPPKEKPSEQELQTLRDYAAPKMIQQLKGAYPHAFDGGFDLKVTKSEINDKAKKPKIKYNLYVEFEGIGTFKKNAPPPMKFYSELSSFSSKEFLSGVKAMDGCFGNVSKMAINPCAWIDNLDDGEGGSDGDPSSGGSEDAGSVPIHVEFWLALVVPSVKAVPDQKHIETFDEMMNEFLTETLQKAYGEMKFDRMDLERVSFEFDQKKPLPRFNVLHNFTADVYLHKPLPDPSDVLSKIIKSNKRTMMENVIRLSAPWDDTREGTMGSATAEKTVDAKIYSGRRSQIKKKPSTKSLPPVSPVPEPVKVEPSVLASPKPPLHSPKPKKSTIPRPTPPPVLEPLELEVLESWADIYVALKVEDDAEPTSKDYEKLAKMTELIYSSFLSKKYGKDIFHAIRINPHVTKFNAGLPDPKYNVYVEWNIQASFEKSKAEQVPDRAEFCHALASGIEPIELLQKYRRIKNTPFESAVSIFSMQNGGTKVVKRPSTTGSIRAQ